MTLRIQSRASGDEDPVKGYLERLVKLIPSEVIGLYLAGRGAIQATYRPDEPPIPAEAPYWIVWTVFCFLCVILVRGWATRSSNTTQWSAVAIAAASFVLWTYSMGDVFVRASLFGEWQPLLGTLLILGWTFLVPLFYKGDPAPILK